MVKKLTRSQQAAFIRFAIGKLADSKTDREIARVLKMPRERITKARQRLGIIRKRGRPTSDHSASGAARRARRKIQDGQSIEAMDNDAYMRSLGYEL